MRKQVAYVERLFKLVTHGSGCEFHIIEELCFIFIFLKRNTPDIKYHVGEDHSNFFHPYRNP